MKHAIKSHLVEMFAVLGLLVLAAAIGGYILSQQRFRFPLIEHQPKLLEVELDNAQAVQPGQGQTVRVAGVQIGQISDVHVEDGVAVVQIEIDEQFENVMNLDRDMWLKEIAMHDDLFFKLYDRLPKEMTFIRELTVSSLWRSPELGLAAPRPEPEQLKAAGKAE